MCDTCPVSDAQQALWPENADAWAIFQRLAQRFVVDAGLTPMLLTALTTDRDPQETVDLLERLTELYDIVVPRKESHGA